MTVIPDDFTIICRLVVVEEHNAENNPEFYKIWDEIKTEFDEKCINSVKIRIIKETFDEKYHAYDNILFMYVDVSNVHIGNTEVYNCLIDLNHNMFEINDIYTINDVKILNNIRQHIYQKVDDIMAVVTQQK